MSPTEPALALAPVIAPAREPAPTPIAEPSRRRARPEVSDLLSDLHARHGKELLGFCRWMLKDPDEAADAMQDMWMRALTALSDGDIRVAALRPWLYAIARNVCLDRLRDRKRQSLQDTDAEDFGTTPGAEQVVEVRQEAAAALALVAALSERQRQALLMREVAGMAVPDIARALGTTPERAAWAITDAHRALDEARSGSAIDCADVRGRLGAGRRGRRLRAHLQDCSACRAYDAKHRVRRVLAPAVLPVPWLRHLLRPLLFKPATAAAVIAGMATAGIPLALHDPNPFGPDRTSARPASAPEAEPAAKPARRPDTPARHPSPAHRTRPDIRPTATAPAAVGRRTMPATHPEEPVAGVESRRPVPRPVDSTGPATAAAALVHDAHRAISTTARTVVDTVRHTAAVAPAAAPVVDRTTGTVVAVVDALG